MKSTTQNNNTELALMLNTDATTLTISTPAELQTATSLLSKINTLADNIQAEKEKVTLPLKQALKAEQDRWKPTELAIKEAVTTIRTKMSDYQTSLLKHNEAISVEVGTGDLTVEQAIEKLHTIPTKTVTNDGSITFRTQQKLNIYDPLAIPRHYCTPDATLILNALKAGFKIDGARLDTVQVPVNKR